MVNGVCKVRELSAITLLLLVNIVGTHTGKEVALITVHIDQCLEAVLLAAVKEPIDRTLLIDFQVVGIEVIDEVAADHFTRRTFAAESVSDELEVFFKCLAAVDSFYPLYKASGDVIIEVVIVADRDDVVLVGNDGAVLRSIPFTTGIGKTRLVQRVASEHTANSIGEERANIASEISLSDRDIPYPRLRVSIHPANRRFR